MQRTVRVNKGLLNPEYTIEQIYYTAIRGEKEFKVRARQKKFFVDYSLVQMSYSCPKWIWQNKRLSKQAAVLAIIIRSFMSVKDGTVKPISNRLLLKFFCNSMKKAKTRANASQRIARYFKELELEGYIKATWRGVNFNDFDARNKYRMWDVKVMDGWYEYIMPGEATEAARSRPQKQHDLATEAVGKKVLSGHYPSAKARRDHPQVKTIDGSSLVGSLARPRSHQAALPRPEGDFPAGAMTAQPWLATAEPSIEACIAQVRCLVSQASPIGRDQDRYQHRI